MNKVENKKKPIATIPNLKANAENGSLLSIIGLVVINADDHKNYKYEWKYFDHFGFIKQITLN